MTQNAYSLITLFQKTGQALPGSFSMVHPRCLLLLPPEVSLSSCITVLCLVNQSSIPIGLQAPVEQPSPCVQLWRGLANKGLGEACAAKGGGRGQGRGMWSREKNGLLWRHVRTHTGDSCWPYNLLLIQEPGWYCRSDICGYFTPLCHSHCEEQMDAHLSTRHAGYAGAFLVGVFQHRSQAPVPPIQPSQTTRRGPNTS